MSSKPIVSHKFYNVPENEQKIIQDIVEKNIEWKMDSYLQKIYANKHDAEVRIDYKISQNKKKKYEANFNFFYDGKVFPYSNSVGFKYVDDLVNHAFKHFKEQLSKQE